LLKWFAIDTVAALAILVFSTAAAAQAPTDANPWSRGTTLNLFSGVSTSSPETGAILGMALGWEVTPGFGIEGSGAWLDRGRDATAFAADLKAMFGVPNLRTIVPFAFGGVGFYRASFGPESELPEFYARQVDDSATFGSHTFTDPSFIVGGGVNLHVTRHIGIRPEYDAKIVRSDGDSYVVHTVVVHFAYHFEEHSISPSRTRRP
jgi:hypothetical protein